MTAPLREVFKNNASTTLDGGINNSVTSITVTSGAVFPSTGNFRVIVGDEIMLVTARSTNTLTVVRGQEGTSGASHSDLDPITQVLTEGGLQRFGRDNNPYWNSNQLVLGKLVADDGTTVLTSSDFTVVNSGSSTITDHNGTINIAVLGSSGTNWRWLARSTPSPTFEYVAAFQIGMWNQNAGALDVAFGLRESGTGKSTFIGVESTGSGGMFMQCRDSSGNTNQGSASENSGWFGGWGGLAWWKVRYDGTDVKFSVSHDGIIFTQVRSVAGTTPFTTAPDQLIWGVYAFGTAGDPDVMSRLVHWSRTA